MKIVMFKKNLLLSFLLLFLLNPVFASNIEERPDYNIKETIEGFEATEKEKESGAVVLQNEVNIQSLGNGKTRLKNYMSFAILDSVAAEKFTQFSFGYNAYYDTLKLDFARVITPDGKTIKASADAIQDIAMNSANGFSDQRSLSLALPGLQAGAFIELSFTLTSLRPIFKDHWWYSISFSFSQPAGNSILTPPVRESTIRIKTSSTEKLKFEITREDYGNFKTLATEGANEFAWQMKNIPAVLFEEHSDTFAEKKPGMHFTTMPKWDVIDDWGKNIFFQSKSNKLIRDLVEEITQRTDNKREKIRKIFSYIQKNIRYISADFKRGGLIPHSPDAVLSNRYGDCKDQATLLVNMLNILDIEAYPALINPFPRRKPIANIPALKFTHMIVFIPDEQGDIWLDPSIPNNSFMNLNWASANRQAFVIDGKGGVLKYTQETKSSDNTVIYDNEFSFDDAKGIVTLSIKVNLSGSFDEATKAQQKQFGDIKKTWVLLLKQMYPKATIQFIKIPFSDSNDKNTSIEATLEFKAISENEKKSIRYLLAGDLTQALVNHSRLLQLPRPQDRQYEYVHYFPYTITIKNRLMLPEEKYAVSLIQEPIDTHNQFYSSKTLKEKSTKDEVISTTFTINEAHIPKEKYEGFHNSLQQAIQNSKWIYLVTLDTNGTVSSTPEEKKDSRNEKNDALSKIQLLIDEMKFTEAHARLTGYIKDNENNGEAYYKLGITLGSLDEYEKSSAAFKKAKKLGYIPQY